MQLANDILRRRITGGRILPCRLLDLCADIDKVDLRGVDAREVARDQTQGLHRRLPAIDPVASDRLTGEFKGLRLQKRQVQLADNQGARTLGCTGRKPQQDFIGDESCLTGGWNIDVPSARRPFWLPRRCRLPRIGDRDSRWKHGVSQKPAHRAQHTAEGRVVSLTDCQPAAKDHGSDHRRNCRTGDRSDHVAAERRDRNTTIDDGRRGVCRLAERRRKRAKHDRGGKHRGLCELPHCAPQPPRFPGPGILHSHLSGTMPERFIGEAGKFR